MNFQTLNDDIKMFRDQVIESGFRRDVVDFASSLPNIQGNIIALREVAKNVYSVLERIHAGDLPEALHHLFPQGNPAPFTSHGYHEQLKKLMEDKAIDQSTYAAQLQNILNKLSKELDKNVTEIDRIDAFINPYVQGHQKQLSAAHKAIFSIIFKHKPTITRLPEFTRTISAWNATLPLYHQLVTNASPTQIEIVEVQNGSIDFVVNLDAKVAIDLAELFKIGLIAYASYLAQKKFLLPMMAGYFGNPKLKELDEEKEKVLLENIGEAVANKAMEQHQKAPKGTSGVDNPDKAVELVSRLVTAHIVRGNDVKILALSPAAPGTPESNVSSVQKELNEASVGAREALRELPEGSTTLLLKEYGEIHSDDLKGDVPSRARAKKAPSPGS
ncbi:MAG: hypothetical protein ACO1TE_25410 [Prosthecobacter sp.]